MAKKKSRSKTKGRLGTFMWMIIMAVTGTGIGGFLNPEWAIVGPFVQNLKSRIFSSTGDLLDSNPSPGLNLQGQPQTTSAQLASPQTVGTTTPAQLASSQRPVDKLLICSFNIQVFGQSKMGKNDVMAIIVQIIRQFDLVAIQEIRTKEDDLLPRLIAMLNADGSQYKFLIGPRLGRSVSTEQYVFVYDSTRVEHDPSSVGTVGDPEDLLHREPFAARFRPRTNPPERAFSFWLVNIHTDPDDVPIEVDALADVFQVMQKARPDEDDVILLGDLNASESQMGNLGKIPGISWVVSGGVMTNTRMNKAYDNIVFHGPSTREYTGRWGVYNVEEAFGLSRDEALKVSDHFPVWAEFQIWESEANGRVAEQTSDTRR